MAGAHSHPSLGLATARHRDLQAPTTEGRRSPPPPQSVRMEQGAGAGRAVHERRGCRRGREAVVAVPGGLPPCLRFELEDKLPSGTHV
jgi:hypothetical protein